MLSWANLEDIQDVYLRSTVPLAAVAVLLLVAVAYAAFLYQRHRTFGTTARISLALLRAGTYVLLVLLLFEPVAAITKTIKLPSNILVLLDVSESMGVRDPRRRPEDVREAAELIEQAATDSTADGSAETVPAERPDPQNISRLELARNVLSHPALPTATLPNDDYRVTVLTFGDRLERLDGLSGDAASSRAWLSDLRATGQSTRLGDAVLQAVDQFGGQTITGVVVLTDGCSNEGSDPLEAALRLKERSIPLYLVGLGLKDPDNVAVRKVIVPDVVFHKDKVPVRVLIESRGFAERSVELSVRLDDEAVANRTVQLTDGTQFEEITFVPQRAGGQARLEVALDTLDGEVSLEDNVVPRSLKVIDEKIKVLYVEGKPRWEYRYLRGVLLRDHRLDVKFLLTEGDPDLAKTSPLYLARFPEEADRAFRFDLVIVGDVPKTHFTAAQLKRLEELVRDHGASFLMLAGHQHSPQSYGDSPIASLLPVRLGETARETVDPSLHPAVTDAGSQSLMVSLEPSAERTTAVWSLVRPLYDVPRLAGTKSGAKVLLTLSDWQTRDEPYPLVAWHRYGTGKSMFVGTDQLWRLRLKRGDHYHARFWGQAIQFLTLSRLLGENRRIRIETDRDSYRQGERVQVLATVLDDDFAPVVAPGYSLVLDAPNQAGPAALRLEPVPGQPGLHQGFTMADAAGTYSISTLMQDKDYANTASFDVEAASRELLQPHMREGQLKKMADLSGGNFYGLADIPELADAIKAQPKTMSVRQEHSLWDHWTIVLVLLTLTGTEWYVRRRLDAA
jgi:hypothetical protein